MGCQGMVSPTVDSVFVGSNDRSGSGDVNGEERYPKWPIGDRV